MVNLKRIVPRWFPALTVMLVIFYFSSRPSKELPDFGWADYLVKKGGHFIVYALLALTIWHAFEWRWNLHWLVWIFSMLYAATDEFHQSFVPGRHPSVWDVLLFDNLGVVFALWLAGTFKTPKRPGNHP